MGAIVRQVALLLALAVVPGLVQAVYLRDKIPWTAEARTRDEVTVEAARAFGDQLLWLDARPEHEFEQEHIPGALPLNEDRFEEQLVAVMPQWTPEKRIVVYCGETECGASRAIAGRLRKELAAAFGSNPEEIRNVFVLKGGWKAWKAGQ